MPIPITDNFKRLLDQANPEQVEALKTSKVESDSKGVGYVPEMKKKYDPIWAIDLGVKESDASREFKWAYERFANHPDMIKLLNTLENHYFTKTFSDDNKQLSNELTKNIKDEQ